MTQHARTDRPQESEGGDAIDVQLPREEVEALLLASMRCSRSSIGSAPESALVPAEAPAAANPAAPADEDALQRVTRLARQSLEEARLIVGERRITSEQRRAWKEGARRYGEPARRSVRLEGPHDRAR